jgi:putative RecB family exonuclease
MPDYISPSQISMFLRCPSQYYFRYCEGLILPSKSVMIKGKAVHKGQEINYKQKIQTKQDLSLSDVQDAAATEFDSSVPETEWKPDEDKGKIKDEVITLAGLYHKEVAPMVQPEYVEEEVYFEADGLKFKGFIDVVQEGGIIRDTKTTAKTPSQDIADKSLQLTAYSFAYRTLLGQEEKKVVLDYLVNTKTPKYVPLESSRCKDDIDRFLAIAKQISKAIQSGIFYPNVDNFMCNSEHCGYWHKCHEKYK